MSARYLFHALLLGCLVLPSPARPGSAALGPLVSPASRSPAPELELTDVYGVRHRLGDMRGSVVLVNFWASWCPPCRWEMPDLQALWERLGGENFRILAVAVGEDRAAVNRYYHSLPAPLTFTLLPDPANRAAQRWPLHGLPATFVIDTTGRVAYLVSGARQWNRPDVVEALRALMAEPERTTHRHRRIRIRLRGQPLAGLRSPH